MKRRHQQQQEQQPQRPRGQEATGLMHSLVAAAALEQEQDEADDYHHPLPPLPFPPPPPPPPPLPPGLHDHPLLPPPVPRYAYYGAAGGAYPMGFPPPPPPLPLGFDPAAPFPFAPTLSPPPRTGGRKGAGGRKRARAAGGDLLLGPSEAALGGGLFLSPLSSPCYDGYLFSKPRARKPTAVADDAPHAVPFPEAASAAAAAPQLAPLVRALSSRARRFALCEWFYSSLDRGFFNEDAFGGALDAAGLAHLRHWSLTRTEWGAVRAALGGGVGGRPRRLSPAFLRQERQRLAAYRRVIRELQQGRLAAPPPGFPFEVPAKLEVGLAVTARHPRAHLLARGQILTADYDRRRYRVQFERPELGSEVCTDTDIAVQGPPALLFAKPRRPEPALLSSSSLPVHHAAAAALLLPASVLAGTSSSSPSLPGAVAAFVRQMLDRKAALVACLQGLNEQAEAVAKAAPVHAPAVPLNPGASPMKAHARDAASSPGSPEGKGLLLPAAAAAAAAAVVEFSPVLKQQYAWAVQALQRINAALLPAMEMLRQQAAAAEGGGAARQGGGGEAERARALVATARAEARRLCARHHASRAGELMVALGGEGEARSAPGAEEVLAQGGSVQALVEAAAAVILTLRRCAEARKQRSEDGKEEAEEGGAAAQTTAAAAGLTALGTEQCVAAAMEELKRRVLLLFAGADSGGGEGEEDEEEGEQQQLYEETLGLLEEIHGSVAFLQNELLL